MTFYMKGECSRLMHEVILGLWKHHIADLMLRIKLKEFIQLVNNVSTFAAVLNFSIYHNRVWYILMTSLIESLNKLQSIGLK